MPRKSAAPMKNKVSQSAKNKIPDSQNKPGGEPDAEKTAEDVWQNDIEKHDYYYDDSHGYEIYRPDDDEEENDADQAAR